MLHQYIFHSNDPLPHCVAMAMRCKSVILQVAAIGPTTAEALASAGVQVDATSSKPNAESLVQVITDTVLL